MMKVAIDGFYLTGRLAGAAGLELRISDFRAWPASYWSD